MLPRDVPPRRSREQPALRRLVRDDARSEHTAELGSRGAGGDARTRREVPCTDRGTHAAGGRRGLGKSRVDVSEATRIYHRSALFRAEPLLDRHVDAIKAADVADLVGDLVAKGRSRETIRKTVTVLAMVFDHCSVMPNPARDRVRVKLPRDEREEVVPPSGDQVEAVHRLLAPAPPGFPSWFWTRLGMRVGELEQLTWGDVDEQRTRWRVSRSVLKTGAGRWVNSSAPVLFDALAADLCPRDDRTLKRRRLFEGVTGDRLRTAIARACVAAGIPHPPHGLRHRRISLLHLGGAPGRASARASANAISL